jgi:hypothetical protein
MTWVGHVARMGEMSNAYETLAGNLGIEAVNGRIILK